MSVDSRLDTLGGTLKRKRFNTAYLQDGYDPRLRRHTYHETTGSGCGFSYAAGTGVGDGNGSGAAAASGDTVYSNTSIGNGVGNGNGTPHNLKDYEIKNF